MSKVNISLFIARRLGGRQGGRSNSGMIRIAAASVAVSIAAIIVAISVLQGFQREISAKIVGFGSHLSITNFDSNASLETVPIGANQPFLGSLGTIPEVVGVQQYAIKGGILKTRDEMHGVMFKGVGSDFDWTFFSNNLKEGSILDYSDSTRKRDVLISRSIARMMKLKPGDAFEVLFFRQRPRSERFRVAGIYSTGLQELDDITIIGDLRAVQRTNGWSAGQVSGFEVRTSDYRTIDQTQQKVAALIDLHTDQLDQPLLVTSIRERFPNVFDWLNLLDTNVAIVIIIMLLVSGFNMIGAMLIILLDKTSMIGILKSMGIRNRPLQGIFVLRSFRIIARGLFWGNAVGLGICLLQKKFRLMKLDEANYFIDTVPIVFNWGHIALVNGLTFAVIAAVVTLPTLIVSRISPEKTIRFE